MERIIPYIMENKKCLKPPPPLTTHFWIPPFMETTNQDAHLLWSMPRKVCWSQAIKQAPVYPTTRYYIFKNKRCETTSKYLGHTEDVVHFNRGSKQSCCTNIGFWSKFLFYLLLSSGYPWPGHHYWTMHLDAKAWPPIEGRPPGHHLVHSSGDFAVLWGSQKPWREMTPSTCLLIHVPSLYCICLLTLKSLSGNNTPCLDCSIMIQCGAAPEL